MRILYLSPRPPWPLTSGAMLRDFHLAAGLARSESVTWFEVRPPQETPPPPPQSPDPFEDVISVERNRSFSAGNLIRGAVGPDPVIVLNFWSPKVAAQLQQVLGAARFDTVQIEGVHFLRYVPVIRASSPGTAIVADWHNIESEIMRRYSRSAPTMAHRLFASRTAGLIERAEDRLLRECDAHAVTSGRESGLLLERNPQANLYTIPNGVDVAFYRPAVPVPVTAGEEILFVGSMDYHANVDAAEWFAAEVWPSLSTCWPGVSFAIVGRNPGARVRALHRDGVVVTGTVDDIRPYYKRAFAVVAPVRVGSGTRLKILEAMAAGVPVVSTTLGAEGLDVKHGENILLADTPAAITSAILELKSSAELRKKLILAAMSLVEHRYDWQSIGGRLLEVHRAAARRVSGRY